MMTSGGMIDLACCVMNANHLSSCCPLNSCALLLVLVPLCVLHVLHVYISAGQCDPDRPQLPDPDTAALPQG